MTRTQGARIHAVRVRRGGSRRRRPAARSGRAAVGACAALVAAAALFVPPVPAVAGDPFHPGLCFGAASMERGSGCVQQTSGPTVPSLEDAPADRSQSYRYRCQTRPDFTDRHVCEFGDPGGSRSVALVGNSHAVQWLPALHDLGLRQGFKVTTFLSAVCAVTTTRMAIKGSGNCTTWGDWVRATTAAGDFDLIVQSDRAFRPPVERGDRDAIYERGFRRHLQVWADAGKTVLVIRGTPKPVSDVPSCLAANRENYATCAVDRALRLLPDPLALAARSFASERIRVADLTDYFCRPRTCPVVIGGVVVYFDASHVTATYARSVAPYLEQHVTRALLVDAAARLTGAR